MRILIGSPLYPPDLAQPAPYVKELAERLSRDHSVHLVVYGEIPEKIPKVIIDSVSKKKPLFQRIFSYTKILLEKARSADVLYIQNGASVELPTLLVSFVTKTPVFLGISDMSAYQKSQRTIFLKILLYLVRTRARGVIQKMPLAKPEILP